jgi:hypothetical protein
VEDRPTRQEYHNITVRHTCCIAYAAYHVSTKGNARSFASVTSNDTNNPSLSNKQSYRPSTRTHLRKVRSSVATNLGNILMDLRDTVGAEQLGHLRRGEELLEAELRVSVEPASVGH